MISLVTSGMVLVGLQILIFWIINRRMAAEFSPETVYSL
jgi:hypothetical protein